ncbi:hypothetical protein GLYMA_U005200v4 [Glycine max]|uniref:Uncharacterized protein n=1 Tax=Glycine max TaxID=3847 RepID=A0A0R0E3U2_SOYBN|nr:hypothetical protein GLYMA_U005200v4 [Glycine max]
MENFIDRIQYLIWDVITMPCLFFRISWIQSLHEGLSALVVQHALIGELEDVTGILADFCT